MLKGFIFNTDRCVGCHACIVACSNQNDVAAGGNWRSVFTYNEARMPAIPAFFHSIACYHCEDAPCMVNCPSNALYRDPLTQAVLVKQAKCIGCKYCTWACPYDAPEYNPFKKVVEKCTLCVDRVTGGDIPACAKCCPTGALEYNDIDPNAQLKPVKGFSDYGIGPGIKFVSAGKKERTPEMAGEKITSARAENYINNLPEPLAHVSLASEWPLALFTYLVPLVIGIFAEASTSQNVFFRKLFLLLGSISLLVSLFHLGKKQRFYRAIVNLKHSWLSREILFYLLFLGASFFTVIAGFSSLTLIFPTLMIGFLATFSIDRVYQLQSRVDKKPWHSSQTLFTAMLFISIFLESFFPFIFVLALKLLLYIYRKIDYKRMNKDPRWSVSLMRILFGIISPFFLLFMTPENGWLIILFLTITGELIDRMEFYHELDYCTPGKEFHEELISELKQTG